jgi:hypothetical protein
LPHHFVTASKQATATEVHKCSDQLAIFEGSENEGLVLSGTVISNHEEHRLMKIPKVEGLPCQQMTFTSKQFMI